MSSLESRQHDICQDLRLLICNASVLLEIMNTETPSAGEWMQMGADTIRSLAADLMAKV